MNISEVKVKLTGNDLISIINEFVKVEGLTLSDITIDDNGITLDGSFKKGFTLNFQLGVEVIGCTENKVSARISKVKVLNIGMFKILRSFALRQLAKAFSEKGIDSEKDKILIDLDKIIDGIPFVNLKVNELFIKGSELCTSINDINISLSGGLENKSVEEKEDKDTDEIDLEALNNIKKVNDSYSKGRDILGEKLPVKLKSYKDYIFVLPDIVSLIYRLLKDDRVSVKTKAIISGAIAYTAFPTDIIPDNIPFIGKIDDMGVLFFALNTIVNDVPIEIIVENWTGKNDILIVLKKGIDYLINFTGAKNVEKIFSVVEELAAAL